MRKFLTTSSALVAISIVMASQAQAKHRQPQQQPVQSEIASDDFNRLTTLDTDCRTQLKPQWPSWFKNVGLVALRNTPGALVGGIIGAKVGGFVPKGAVVTAAGYGKNAAVNVVGGSIGAGINGYEMGKHTSVANCQDNFVRRAARERPGLRNVVIVYNSFQVNGHPVRGPNGQKLGKGDYFTLVYHPEHPEADEAPSREQREPAADDNDNAPPPGN